VEGILTSWNQGQQRTWYKPEERQRPSLLPRACSPAKHPRKIHVHFRANRKWKAYKQAFLLAAQKQSCALVAPALPAATANRFHALADEWTQAVGNSSSLTAMTRHPKYREIVQLGWPVVPHLLKDLQRGRGFWFPALEEITGIRPFDLSDAGNSMRMIQAWVQWGKRKQLI